MDLELRRQMRQRWQGTPERIGIPRAACFGIGGVEMRAKSNGTPAGPCNFEFTGYSSVYGYEFDMWDKYGEPFKERVAPGAAKRSLMNPDLDTPFLIGHNEAGFALARTTSKTMQLAEDTHGMHVHVPSFDGRSMFVREMAIAVERGDMSEMSLAFIANAQEWDDNYETRTITQLDVHRGDVCIVVHGANPATAGAQMWPVEQLSFRRPAVLGGPGLFELRAAMATADKNDLPDSAFAYIEPGGEKDDEGKTTPRSKRHFPVHDAAHVRNALARIAQGAEFSDEALPAVKAAAKKFGVTVSTERAVVSLLERLASAAEDMDQASASDYNAAAADHPYDGTHTHEHSDYAGGTHTHEHDHSGDASHGHHAGTSATVTVDASTGIPGPETQMSATRKLELMARELELEELASRRRAAA